MFQKTIWINLVLLLFTFGLAGCVMPGATPTALPIVVSPEIETAYTQAAQTVVAELTRAAEIMPTSTQVLPTETLVSSETPIPDTPEPTQTILASLEPTHTQSPITTALASPSATTQARELIRDDFEQDQGWYTNSGDDYGFEYSGEGYRIYNKVLNAAIWSVREQEYTGAILEVDASKLAGPADSYYGLLCHFQDSNNYYSLVIGNNGFFGIGKMEDGEFEFLQSGIAQAGLIKAGNDLNRIRAECYNEKLVLYSNGVKLTEIDEDDFTSGKVGLLVGNQLIEAGIDVLFDNFVLYQP